MAIKDRNIPAFSFSIRNTEKKTSPDGPNTVWNTCWSYEVLEQTLELERVKKVQKSDSNKRWDYLMIQNLFSLRRFSLCQSHMQSVLHYMWRITWQYLISETLSKCSTLHSAINWPFIMCKQPERKRGRSSERENNKGMWRRA